MSGEIRVVARLSTRHSPQYVQIASAIGAILFHPFHRAVGGPGGWWILDAPEIYRAAPIPGPRELASVREVLAVVPYVAGWRRERMPELPATAYFERAPDWVCEIEVGTPGEGDKWDAYARAGVDHAWSIDPVARTVAAYALEGGRRWRELKVHRDSGLLRFEPFTEIEVDVAAIWDS